MAFPELVVGTQNRDKGTEIFARLGHLPLRLRGMWEWSDAEPVEETGQTLKQLMADVIGKQLGVTVEL